MLMALAASTASAGPVARRDLSVRGRLYAADGAPAGGLAVRLRAGWYTASAVTSDSGTFAADVPDPLGGAIELLVDADADSLHRFFPSRVRLDGVRARSEVRIVMIPRRWTIGAGSYAGETVLLRPASALGRGSDGPAFWRLSRRARRSGWAVGWEARAYPIPIAFDTTGRRRVGAADSAAFWDIARQLERDLGQPVFRPVQAAEVLGDIDGVLVRTDGGMRSAGLTLISWNERGRAYDGALYVQHAWMLGDARVVTHELLHALGFGHATGWYSVMSVAPNGPGRATAVDVAHVQLLLRVRALQDAVDAPYGVAEAVDAIAAGSANEG
jgi:hypothetical protein